MAHINFFGNHKEARKMGSIGERSIVKALELAKKFFQQKNPTTSLEELMSSSSAIQISANLNATECPKEPVCRATKYRTADGSCNNKYYPSWGKSFIAYNRILSANYGDGINSPALSKSKQELPNVRMISVELTRHKHPPTSRLSLIAMQFGQFIDHDIASAAPTRTEQGLPISCCNPAVQRDPENLKHPSCYEIAISKNDPFFSHFNITCMNFVRSVATQRQDCKLAPREQMNQPTSFIDGSQIYGSNLETQLSLRLFNGGQLLSSLINHFQFLPRQTNGTCNVPNNEVQKCFRAGDPRGNENIDLTVLQTVFLREHNRLASELQELNPQWSDEELYQEAKAIVTAELQHITYNEFLPSLLNRQTIKQFDLYPTENGFNYKYDPKINPTLFNSFATAGYRLHSTIQGILQLRNNKDELVGEIPLSATFNNPSLLSKPGVYDGLIRGMTSQPMQELDQYFTSEVTNRLFKPHNSSFGLDIFSLNLQRGRDHGLRGYTRYQKQCGLQPIKSFNDLDTRMPKKLVNFFKRHYESVHDIDLYAAGIVENHLPNSEVGPTFSCLIGEQFRRLKYGDSFFYENGGFQNSFTPEQLAEIKKVTMARLLCDNGDFVEYMQPNAFILPKYWFNKKVSCSSSELIDKMCLLPWSKNPTYKKK